MLQVLVGVIVAALTLFMLFYEYRTTQAREPDALRSSVSVAGAD